MTIQPPSPSGTTRRYRVGTSGGILLYALSLGGYWGANARAAEGQTAYFMPPPQGLTHSVSTRPTPLKGLAAGSPSFTLQASAPSKVFPEPDLATLLRRHTPITIEHRTESPIAFEKGVTTIFALPVSGVKGLDLTASFFGGHRDTRLGAPPGSAAITGGLRFRW